MGKSRGIRAGAAFIELTSDNTLLQRGLRAAQQRLQLFASSLQSIGRNVALAGVAMAAGLGVTVRIFERTGSQLYDMSRRTGAAVEALSTLGYAASQDGASIESLEKGLRKMQRTLIDAKDGGSESAEAFKELGLDVGQLLAMSPDQQFLAIANAVAKIEKPAMRTALAFRIFGRDGAELIPLLERGRDGIEALQEHARRLGLEISTNAAAAADELGDSILDMTLVTRALAFAVGSALAPKITAITKIMTQALVLAGDWIKRNQAIVSGVAALTIATIGLGGSLVGLGFGIGAVSFAIKQLASVALLGGRALAFVFATVGLLLTPIGLAAGAIAALGATWFVMSGRAVQSAALVKSAFADISSFMGAVGQGIRDALAGDDMALAAQVLWLGLKVAWLEGTSGLNRIWQTTKAFFLNIVDDMWFGALAIAEYAWFGMQVGWTETVAFMSKLWTRFSTSILSVWERVQGFLAKGFLEVQGLFDETLDVKAAKEGVEAGVNKRLGELGATESGDLADIERRRANDRRNQSYDRDQALTEIGRNSAAANRGLRNERDSSLKSAQDRLAEAQEQLREAIKQASRAREEGAARAASGISVDGLDSLVGQTMKSTALGLFNAAGLLGLQGSGSAADRTAKATEQTARNTKRLAETGGATFA